MSSSDAENSAQPSSIDKSGFNKQRRYFLIGATSAVAGVGVVGAAVPFVASWNPSAKARALGAPITVDISKLQPGGSSVRFQPGEVFRYSSSTAIRTRWITCSATPTTSPIRSLTMQNNNRGMRGIPGVRSVRKLVSISGCARTSAVRRNTTVKSKRKPSMKTGRVVSSVPVMARDSIWPVGW